MVRRAWRVRYLPQTSTSECGAACLAMVLGYFGHRVTVREMRERLGVGRDGSSAGDIVRAARQMGLAAEGRRCTMADLEFLPLPLIAFQRGHHFVVIEHLHDHGVVVVDPNRGRFTLTDAEFAEEFAGVVLVFNGPMTGRGGGRDDGLWRFVLNQVPRTPGPFVLVAALSLALAGIAMVPAFVIGYLVDTVLPTGDAGQLLVVLGAVVGLVLGRLGVGLARCFVLVRLQSALDERLSTRFIEHLFRLPLPYFGLRTNGDLLNRVASSNVIRELLTSQAVSIGLDLVTAVIYAGVLIVLAPDMALIVLGVALVQVVLVVVTAERFAAAARREVQLLSTEQSRVLEALTGIESVKLSALEPEVLRRWRTVFTDGLAVSRHRQIMEGRVEELIDAIEMLLTVGIVVYGAYGVLAGSIELGAMLTATTIAASLIQPICALAGSLRSLQGAAVHLARLRDVVEEAPEPGGDGPLPTPVRGHVRLRGVGFAYPGAARPTLEDISLDVPAGTFLAVVGSSGSGKSTLARLIYGLLPPSRGSVRIDGYDLATTPRTAITAACGAVAQEPAVFSGTVLENIRIGRPDASLDQVVHAAGLAHLHQDISAMPLGYETLLSERGVGLSGGQRQRLALTRALIREPRLLLLDEATSAVDAETERVIFENLTALPATLIVIAHRLSTVQAADQIVVLEQGRLVERGTHEELCVAGGRYATLTAGQRVTPTGSRPDVLPGGKRGWDQPLRGR